MKKLTWLFLSLMLVLGMGTAFAQNPAAPTFNPDGGEVEAEDDITITTTTTDATVYYINGTTASFVSITTKTALEEAESNDQAKKYSNGAKPTLGDYGVETPGAKLSFSAAAALIDGEGNITWSEVTTREFTVKGDDTQEPVETVAQPVITPPNGGKIKLDQKVTITCATTGATIYYTTNGSAPFTTDASGDNYTGISSTATQYTEPFSLPASTAVGDEITIRAIAQLNNAFSEAAARAVLTVQGDEPTTPTTVPTPTFTPNSGTVAPGDEIEFDIPDAFKLNTVYLLYTIDATTLEELRTKEIDDNYVQGAMGGQTPLKGAGAMSGNWIMPCQIPDDAPQGQITFGARMVVEVATGTYIASELVTANYTVEGEAAGVPSPTFNPVSNTAVDKDSRVEILSGFEETASGNMYIVYYVIDNADFDFSQYTTEEAMDEVSEAKYVTSGSGVKITKACTIKAATAKRSGYDDEYNTLLTWSKPAVATYTIKGEEPITPPTPPDKPKAPAFNPQTGNTVAVGSKIVINGYGDYVYYMIGGSDEDFNLTYEQLKGQNNLTLYNEETGVPVTATGAMTIRAAGVNIKEADQLVTWSTVKKADYTVVERPVAPTFNPDGGQITETTEIVLTNGTENTETQLKIYYTKKGDATVFDGVTTAYALNSAQNGISKKLWLYDGPLTTTKDTTIHAATAMVIGEGTYAPVIWSEPVTRRFTIAGSTPVVPETPVAPVFDPDGGEIEATAGITITSACSSCEIYYTSGTASFLSITTKTALDEAVNNQIAMFYKYYGSAKPTLSEFNMETPGAKLSLTAAAASIDGAGNITWSETTTKEFTVKAGDGPVVDVATPTITPPNDPGIISVGQNVTIECTTNGAKIYYTTDKSAPFNADNDGNPVSVKDGAIEYTGPFPVTESMVVMQENVATPNGIVTVRAIAVKDGKISEAVRGSWEVIPGKPDFSVVSGKVASGTKVTISVKPSQAKIYYTTDGSTPTEAAENLYTDPIEITAAMTLKAFAVLGQRESAIATAQYTLKTEDDANLTFDPASGAEVEEGTAVTITADKDVKIFYMMYGSKDAATSAAWNQEEATFYSEATKPVLSKEKNTIKAAYIHNGEEAINNDFAYATYTVKDKTPVVEGKDTLPMPKFNPVGGEVEKGTAVVLSCDTADAKIYYSINADTVTVNSLEYTAAISIDSNMTIKAIAVKDGFVDSKVAEASYTIKKEEPSANEGLELQGVSIYPNPNNGTFIVDLPVDATVEVFATSGMLAQRMNVTAGKATLTINQSGIYFVRITGEGRTTVKRVIVR